jgi:DNA-binding MarR family transcriptional regulator
VFDGFVRIWADWWFRVPTGLARQEASVVARLLMLGSREGGISQSDLQRELQMNQPRLSKLMRKLLKVGWIQVKRSKTDRRIRLMTTTVSARARMASLKQDLAAFLRAQGVRPAQSPVLPSKPVPFRRGKVIRAQQGQTGFFDDKGEPMGLD